MRNFLGSVLTQFGNHIYKLFLLPPKNACLTSLIFFTPSILIFLHGATPHPLFLHVV